MQTERKESCKYFEVYLINWIDTYDPEQVYKQYFIRTKDEKLAKQVFIYHLIGVAPG